MYLAYSCWSITIPVCARLRGRRFCSWCGQSNQFFVSHYYNPDSQPSESFWATSSRHFDSPDQPFSPILCRSKDNNTVYASSSPPLTTGQPPWKSGTSNTVRRPRHHFHRMIVIQAVHCWVLEGAVGCQYALGRDVIQGMHWHLCKPITGFSTSLALSALWSKSHICFSTAIDPSSYVIETIIYWLPAYWWQHPIVARQLLGVPPREI